MADTDKRFLPSGDEAGTPPEDRPFRPDVEGLRAVAIVLVVLFHVGIPQLRGGFVGVDVFFVVSGFVITGLLLRERQGTGRNSFLAFYARRARRILPAAILVIVVSLVASAVFVSTDYARLVASDARWTAVFLANVHMAHVYPNYLVPRPQSPLQPFWSLGVEEQFYVVYPALFVALVAGARRLPRGRLALCLAVVIVASFVYSVASTHTGQLAAYDSPLTRAWELALGALLAVGAGHLERLPARVAATMTWVGLAAILVSAVVYSTSIPYPGAPVALPVVGSALVIGGGTSRPRWGTEPLLATVPFRWVGRRSYSWYLWHMPVLIIVARMSNKNVNTQSIAENLVLVIFALALAAATYSWVENPIRHSKWLADNPRATLLGAAALVLGCFALTYAF